MKTNILMVQKLPYRAVALFVPALVAIAFVIILAVTLPQTMFIPMIGLITAYLLPPQEKRRLSLSGLRSGSPGGTWHSPL